MQNVISSVAKRSPAWKAGVRPGDRLISINGKPVADILDYMYMSYDARLELLVARPNGAERKFKLRKGEGEDAGIEFEEYLMDKPHSCANKCIFCFVDQLPKGLRSSLYFKDDDVRLSFLTGSYITLTNLSEREVQRIIDLRITPINISVHSTDPEKRCMMLGNRNAARGLEIMKRFAEAGIEMNCQIVCCPGINDGDELKNSMKWLAELYPSVNSVSVIPVGLTRHREGLYPLKPYERGSAAETVALVDGFGLECYEKYGTRIFFCSDEFYLKAGLPLPEEEYYEEYPQLENGVGLLRLLISEFDEAINAPDAPKTASSEPFSIVTGRAAAPTLQMLLDKAKAKYPNINGTVYAIRNDFFGESVDVAGLITGRDILAQLGGKPLGKTMYISERMLRTGENVFLDDMTTDDLERELGVKIVPTACSGEGYLKTITEDR